MKTKDVTEMIFPLGILYLAYTFMKGQGLLGGNGGTSTATSPECPRGTRYSRGFFGDCENNYIMSGLMGEDCKCLGDITPAPEPTPAPVIAPIECSWLDKINPFNPFCFPTFQPPTPAPAPEPTPAPAPSQSCADLNYPPPCIRPEPAPLRDCMPWEVDLFGHLCKMPAPTPAPAPSRCEPTFEPSQSIIDACSMNGGVMNWSYDRCGYQCFT